MLFKLKAMKVKAVVQKQERMSQEIRLYKTSTDTPSDSLFYLINVLFWKKRRLERRCLLFPPSRLPFNDDLTADVDDGFPLLSYFLSTFNERLTTDTTTLRACKCFSTSKNIGIEDGHEGKLEQQSVSHHELLSHFHFRWTGGCFCQNWQDQTLRQEWKLREKSRLLLSFSCLSYPSDSTVDFWWLNLSRLVSSSLTSFILIWF